LISNHNYATGPLLFGFSALAPPINEEHISDSAGEISPQDSDYGKIYNAQLVETYDAGDGLSIVNRSMYEYEYLRNTELAQYYANLLNSNIVQDRFEIHLDFDEPIGTKSASAPADPKATVDDKDIKTLAKMEPFLDFKHSMIAGLAFKSVSLNDYQGYDNEVLNGTDLSTGTYPQASTEGGLGSGFENVLNIPGTNLYGNPGGNYPTANNPFGLSVTGSENEEAEEGSAFFQDNITFTPQWSLIFGTRVDAIFDNVADSLAPAGVIPAHDNTTEIEPSTNISLDYKPAPWITNYLTFSWSESYTGNTGGGFAYFTPQNTLSGYGYHLQNFLYEGGSKADLLDHTLFLTADGYYQTHYETTALGATTQVRVVGSELQQTYQPNKNFYINLNESYMMATLINPAGEDTYESAFITNPNSPGIDTFAPSTPSNYRESGLPNLLLSGLATYKWDCGVGVSLSYTITDPIPIAEINSAWIPWQYQIDASLFYDAKNWGAKLELYNITDQHNWSSGGYIAQTGNDLITLQEPFHMEGTISYKF
jgi:hypothetical protein